MPDNGDNRNKKTVETYDLIAEKYAQQFDTVESEEELRFLNLFLSYLKPGSSIVDIGCGTGYSSGYFVRKGMNSEGVDLSKKMVAIAKRNYPNIKFSVADMREFKPQEPVDGVWAGYSLFHFEQNSFEETLEKIRTYLKPNGILGIVMQEGEGEIEPNEPFLPERKIYIHLYTEAELKDILAKHGFDVIDKAMKNPKPYEFPYNKILLIAKQLVTTKESSLSASE